MTCQFQKVPVVFNKSLVDLENCTSFLKTTCDLLNSTCEFDLLKLLARHMSAHYPNIASPPQRALNWGGGVGGVCSPLNFEKGGFNHPLF